MLQHDPAAKTHSRLGFTLTMAIALHVAVILGVGFALQVPKAPSTSRMDITLSNYKTDKEVLDADFVAQTNQEASGSESSKKELTTTEFAEMNSATINKVQTIIEMPNQKKIEQHSQLVTTINSETTTTKAQKQADNNVQLDFFGDHERLKRHIEMASLQAKLDDLQQVYARLPRIRRSTSVATKAAEDAEYLYIEGYLVTSENGQDAMKHAKKLAEENGVKTALTFSDPSMVKYFKEPMESVVGAGVDLLFCNEEEAMLYTETENLQDAREALKKDAKRFVITLGANGAMIYDGDTFIDIEPYKVKAIDTNGAGDLFAGAFLYGITNGLSYKQSGELACACSAQLVTQFGPRLEKTQSQDILKKVL